MKSLVSFKFISTGAVVFALSACGPGMPVLPDDPANEPTVSAPQNDANPETSTETGTGGDSQSSLELPSTELVPEAPAESEVAEVTDPRTEILKLYDHVDPSHIVPTKKLEDAIVYFHQNKAKLKDTSVLSVIDFSQKSSQKRWYFINLKTGSVWNIHVAHGKGSDSNHDGFAEKFSNTSGSNASSLGFYKTAETYQGSNGFSLRLDGLSSTNSNARARAVVVHGAAYVQDSTVIQGRSWGCPAVSMDNRDKVINLIKGGSLIYAAN